MKRREKYRVIIQEVFDEHNQIPGPEKVAAVLAQRGYKVSARFVTNFMAETGLHSIRSTAKRDYKKLHKPFKKENILNQQFHTDHPNKVWTSDITYFRVVELHFYICVTIAYKISRKNSTKLVSSTFRLATGERDVKAGLIFHSNRGHNIPRIVSASYWRVIL